MFFSIKTLAPTSILFALALVVPPTNQSQPRLDARAGQTQDPVQLHVTVTDKKDAFVSGLQQDNFEVLIDNKPARIASFDSQDVPAAIGIVFDSSGSMRGTSLKKTRRDFLSLRESIKRFLELSNPSNEYFLMGFNEKPQLLVDWTSDHTRLTDNLNDLTVYGNSAFYDACYLAVDKLQTSQRAKRVLLLVSDGQDNMSRYTSRNCVN